ERVAAEEPTRHGGQVGELPQEILLVVVELGRRRGHESPFAAQLLQRDVGIAVDGLDHDLLGLLGQALAQAYGSALAAIAGEEAMCPLRHLQVLATDAVVALTVELLGALLGGLL